MGKKAKLILNSNSKINLGLKIINKRSDDFHNIQSIFLEINFNDKLTFIPSSSFKLIIQGIQIPNNQENTICKAVALIEKTYNLKIYHTIIIEKHIPTGSGLGGGSSNAAMTLIALNKLYKLKITPRNLKKLAEQISSDAPFFLEGGVQFIEGRGEIISPLSNAPFIGKTILLIFPKFKISTKWAYNNIKKYLHTDINRPKFPTLTNEIDWLLFENDFEKVVSSAYPEILEIKDALYKYGAHYSGLSGSGSTMFGIYNDTDSLDEVISSLSRYHTNTTLPILQ